MASLRLRARKWWCSLAGLGLLGYRTRKRQVIA
jgi:hypothetical protein